MSNSQKFSYLNSLSNLVHAATEDADAIKGRALPCHVVAVAGAIVTVQFDILPGAVQFPQVTIPVMGFEYIRYPIKSGDKGVTISADVSLRGISNLGTGMADLSVPASMTALFFVPLASANWPAEDPDKVTVYAPNGALIKTQDGESLVNVESGAVTTQAEKVTLRGKLFFDGPITQSDAGKGTEAKLIGPVTVELDVTASKISLVGHTHEVIGVQGGDDTIETTAPIGGVSAEESQ